MMLVATPVHGWWPECTDLDVSIPLPNFGFLLAERKEVELDFDLLADYLMIITTTHIQTVFDTEITQYTDDKSILKNVHLSVILGNVIENEDTIKADFVGRACFQRTDYIESLLESGIVQSMTAVAFSNDNYWILLHEFQSNDVLSSMVSKVDVSMDVNIPVGSNLERDGSRSQGEESIDRGMSKGVLSLMVTLVVTLVGTVVLSLVYFFERKTTRQNIGAKSSWEESDCESSCSGVDSDTTKSDEPALETTLTVVDNNPVIYYENPEIAKEAWSKASQEVPPKQQRVFRIPVRRQPSKEAAVMISLSAITEGEDEVCSTVSSTPSLATFVNSVNGLIFGREDRTLLKTSRSLQGEDFKEGSESLEVGLPSHLNRRATH